MVEMENYGLFLARSSGFKFKANVTTQQMATTRFANGFVQARWLGVLSRSFTLRSCLSHKSSTCLMVSASNENEFPESVLLSLLVQFNEFLESVNLSLFIPCVMSSSIASLHSVKASISTSGDRGRRCTSWEPSQTHPCQPSRCRAVTEIVSTQIAKESHAGHNKNNYCQKQKHTLGP